MRKRTRIAVLLITVLPHLALSQQDVSSQLRSEYQGKVLTLRHFYEGENLVFGPEGNLLNPEKVGPWTVSGQIEINHIKLSHERLVIGGRRVLLVFDPSLGKLRDLMAVGGNEKFANLFAGDSRREEWKKVAKHEQVSITIQLPLNTATFAELSSMVTKVFLRPDESMVEAVPVYWRSFLSGETTQIKAPQGFDDPIFSPKQDGVKPPRALAHTNPEYGEMARLVHFSGTVKLSVLVDKSGVVRDVQVTKPAGLGLDERSVEAVRTWKFEPAWREAQPVSSRVEIETSFRLY